MNDVRERIIQAARQCFSENGYSGALVIEICQAAGVAPATLYRYFSGKRALLEATGVIEMPSLANSRRFNILEAALDVFSRRGYHGATMTEIASQAGVARATLYVQFQTKEVLLAELLRENPLVELIGQAVEQPGEEQPARELVRLSEQFLQALQDPRRIALLRLILAEGMRAGSLQRAYHQMVARSLEVFGQYLQQRLPDLPDPQFTARAFIFALFGFVLTQQVIPGSSLSVYSPEAIARQATGQLLNGILPGVDEKPA